MKKILIILLIAFACVSCQRKPKVYNDKPAPTVAQLTTSLTQAFEHEEIDSINRFLADWNSNIRPDTTDKKDIVVAEVYELYKVFFKPDKPKDLGFPNFSNGKLYKYYVVQNKLIYGISSSSNPAPDCYPDTLRNFKPAVNINPDRVLYQTGNYAVALNNLINASRNSKEYDRIFMTIPVPEAPYPYIEEMNFNKMLTKAIIYFKMYHMGGEAVLEKQEGEWIIKSSRHTYVE